MNEPKTPNLGLNKIDRSSPSTTYFDLDKYLDQNWEKVDEGVGQVEEKAEETAAQVSSLQERLDTEKRRSVTLEPGLQIINAERTSAFKLEGLKGRTLVNLLGRDGGFEGYSNWGIGAASANLDTTVYAQGSMSSLKVTLASTNSNISKAVSTSVGMTYVLVADVKNVSTSSTFVSISTVVNGNVVAGSTFGTSFATFTATASTHAIAVVGEGASGQVFNADNVRLYEVSAAEYAALNSMTPEQVAAKYPYVDSVQPVRNPYAIRYGKNMLPPFYEWEISTPQGSYTLTDPYAIKITNTSTTIGQYARYYVPVETGQAYTLSVTISDAGLTESCYMYVCDASKQRIGNKVTSRSITIPAGAIYVEIIVNTVDANGAVVGSFSFKNPMFNIGNTAMPFKPREDSMLALQTNLYADPSSGANADEVFERDGQYFKLAKWKKRLIDGSLSYQLLTSLAGMKEVYTLGITEINTPVPQAIMNKYDGRLLRRLEDSKTVSNLFGINNLTGNLYITISNADSGWGDDFTNPTTDEIKAYFMGWRMFTDGQDALSNTYNGSGTKKWVKIGYTTTGSIPIDAYSSTLPTTLGYVNGTTPYQLLYQLSTPVVETITYEGQLTFFEGANQVEVGTGIVLRELAKPKINSVGDLYTINTSGGDAITALSNKVDKFIGVFRNSKIDTGWTDNFFMPFGRVRKVIPTSNFDPSAAYSVTYLMLDVSPVVPFGGSYAINEKALLTSLSDIVQQNVAATSVLGIAIDEGSGLKNYVDNKPWQKFKITQDNGSVIQLQHNSNLNNIKNVGQYDCFNAVNVPGGVVNAWFYVEVLVHSNAPTHVIQRASRLDTHNVPTLFMRTCMDNIWSPWSPDVFQSGVNAKNGIVDAINAIGGSASTSDSWVQLANKINTIQIGQPQKLMPNIDFSQEFTDTTRLFYLDIATFPPGTKLIQLNRIGGGDSSVVLGSGGTSGTASTVVLIDSNNLEWAVSSTHPTYMRTFLHITIDVQRGTSNFLDTPATGDVTYNMPAGFNVKGLLKLKYKFTKGSGYATFYGRCKSGATIISL